MDILELLKKQDGNGIFKETPDTDEADSVRVIKDITTYAFQQAGLCKASVVVLKNNIRQLYFNKIIDDADFSKKEEERKTEIKKLLHDEESVMERTKSEIESQSHKKRDVETEISELKIKKEKINAGDKAVLGEIQPPDRLGYAIGIFILIFLTTYLFLFYTSAIYNSFVYDVKEASRANILHNKSIATTIFNPNAIVDAYEKSIFTFLFIITSPMIFLGLGYLIHKFNETKKYFYTALILLFTFFFDAILAYAIVSEIYEAKYITGMSGIDAPWEFNMVYSQVPFYIILASGFVIYIVWGVVLSFVINGHNNLNPVRAAIRTINTQIKDLQSGMNDVSMKLKELNSNKLTTIASLKKCKTELEHERFNKKDFEHRVSEFMIGWHRWIDQGFPYEKHQRQAEADSAKDQIIILLYQNNLSQNEEII